MTDLLSLGADVEWPDHEAATVVRERFAARTGYGRLAELAEWVASIGAPETGFHRIRGLVTGPPGHAETAEALGAQLLELDTQAEDAAAAFDAGVRRVDNEVDAGADLLLLAVPHLGADLAIAASVLTNTEPVKVLSRGAAATWPEAWMDLAVQVRDERRRCLALRDRPDELLGAIGSTRLAAAAGVAMRAAVRRTPLVLDGPGAAVGALVAYEAAPRAVRWWCAADLGDDPIHDLALTRLGQKPVLGLGTALGDGLAGLLAVPVLQTAVRLAAGDRT
jgi:nicotinate-nucleotide--dimethylbenzimidazole phosphoribosyltransferase